MSRIEGKPRSAVHDAMVAYELRMAGLEGGGRSGVDDATAQSSFFAHVTRWLEDEATDWGAYVSHHKDWDARKDMIDWAQSLVATAAAFAAAMEEQVRALPVPPGMVADDEVRWAIQRRTGGGPWGTVLTGGEKGMRDQFRHEPRVLGDDEATRLVVTRGVNIERVVQELGPSIPRRTAAGLAATVEQARALAEQEPGVAANKGSIFPPISHGLARVLADQWHSGQASPLYSFVSTGAIDLQGVDREIMGAHDSLHEASEEIKELDALLAYVHHEGDRGPVEGWQDLWDDRSVDVVMREQGNARLREKRSVEDTYGGPTPNRDQAPYFRGEYAGIVQFWQAWDQAPRKDEAGFEALCETLSIPAGIRRALRVETLVEEGR